MAKKQKKLQSEDIEDLPEKGKKAKKGAKEKVDQLFDPSLLLDELQDQTEKKYGLSSTTMDRDEARLSTGLSALDLILNGGIVGGGWYTVYGGEQSAKSTLTMQLLSMITNEVQRRNRKIASSIFDYEGSSDPEYIGNIMQTLGLKGDPSTVFGVKDDDTGEWLVRPTIRYYSHDVGDDFFKYLGKIKRGLPDIEKHGKDYYYVFEHTKENKSRFAGLYDPKYLSKYNKIRIPAPDGFMQAVAICDSYPAMLPDGLDDDDRNEAMAEQARMFSTGIRKIRGGMRKKRMTVIGVNQLREKPATMFGCLHASTKVPFVDGRVHTMKEIVENKIGGEIWSFNEKTRKIEPRPIIDWHYNGDVSDKSHWMKIVTRCPETGNGQAFVICTPNHEILTDNGWKRADEVQHTDRLVSKYTSLRTGTVASFLNGIASGDSSIVADSPNSGLLKLQDNQNPEYVQWKISKLEPFFDFTEYGASHNGECYVTRGSDFVAYSKHVPEREPWKLKFDDLSFAVLYMDDGCLKTGRENALFSFKRFKGDTAALAAIQALFNEAGFGGTCSVDSGLYSMDLEESRVFFERIRKYVPDCMQYKLPDDHKGHYVEFELEGETVVRPVYVDVISIEAGSDRAFRQKGKYDISVDVNHNYMVGNSANGFIVHNSPEYEPCGQALKFYCFRHDTYLTTGDGLITAAEYAALGSGEIQSYKDPEQPTVFKQMGYSQILELETELGLTLAGKPGHRVLAIHTGGFSPKWTKLSDVNSGSMECYVPVKVGSDLWSETYFIFDYEHQSRFGNEQVEVVLPTEMSEELSFVLGVLAGDGHVTGENGLVSMITEDSDLAEYYSECFNEVFGTDLLPKQEKERPHLYTCVIYSTQIAGFLSYLGATGYSRTKKVPLSVRMSPKTCVVSWLQGYTATDGNVGKKGISFNSVSKQLLVDVQQILLNLGVISRLSEYEQNYEHTQAHLKRAWKLACLGSSARDLFDVLEDLGCERKNLAFADSNVSKESTNRLTGLDIIPFDLTAYSEGRSKGKIYRRIEDLLIYPGDKERTEGSQRKRKMYRLDAFTPEWIEETYDWIATLRTSHERQKSKVVFDKFVSFVRGIQDNNLMWVRVTGVNRNVEHAMTYDANMPETSTIVTNGIVSHNSDVRIKSTSRASIPYGGFKLDKGICEEPSVTIKGGKDIYRFVCLKTTKNKLGGIPNREVWARIWVTDAEGRARGFDPVFDTYEYLKQLGYVSGTMANLQFHEDTPLHGAKKCTWLDFKRLVLGSKSEIIEVCTKLGIKPGPIRTWIAKHCASGKGPKRYKDQIVSGNASDDSDDE